MLVRNNHEWLKRVTYWATGALSPVPQCLRTKAWDERCGKEAPRRRSISMPKSMVSKASKVRARSPFVGFQIPQKPLDEAGLRWAEVDHLITYIHLHNFV